MPWSEIGVALATLLTVSVLRRSKRFVRDALNYQPYRASSQPTGRKRTWLDDADPARVAHESKCEACGVVMPVLMVHSRLERRPWRLVWWCRVCGRQSRALCPPELVPTLMEWDRAYGTTLSLREVAEWVSVDLDGLAQAVEDELS